MTRSTRFFVSRGPLPRACLSTSLAAAAVLAVAFLNLRACLVLGNPRWGGDITRPLAPNLPGRLLSNTATEA